MCKVAATFARHSAARATAIDCGSSDQTGARHPPRQETQHCTHLQRRPRPLFAARRGAAAPRATDELQAAGHNALTNAAQQPELPDDGETYQHEQQEMFQPQFEQDDGQLTEEGQMMDEQMAMDLMAKNDIGGGDMSGVQLPDLQQDDEVM